MGAEQEVGQFDVRKTLSGCLPRRDKDNDQWWNLTGKHLAILLEAAEYSLERQYAALLFHYHWTIPYMGEAPPLNHTTPSKGKASLALDGSSIEYSWKWNSLKSPPEVRYTIEPTGQWAGTELDPLNQHATRQMLHDLHGLLPGLENTWSSHFFASMFDHDNIQYVKEAAQGPKRRATTNMAVELVKNGPIIKTYFLPQRLGQKGPVPIEQWLGPLRTLHPDSPSRDAVLDFIAINAEGKTLVPFGIGIDNIVPEKARIKWYFHTPHTSFNSVREIMTLGGKIAIPNMDNLFDQLRTLITSINGVPASFPDDKEVPSGSELDPVGSKKYSCVAEALSGYLYYFDVCPGKELPEIKLYIPTQSYGPDDLSIARALIAWMDAQERGSYCEAYLTALQRLAEHRRLEDDKTLHTFVSCAFKKGEIDVTSYLGAEAFHPGRTSRKGRPGLRRDE
ncbi:dimethylallyl tryptophan synthase GliD1 [Truncatella angustata]|uniref:Dimethylallyl tryptophan synthase GliD1 n=1 Tax=Truncatella angustata TaxID=152316 RepID=A0A9P8UUC3_9PEZI|nr:dimethylallyl tryptophan synthase GliD1 [Truncatella angustata]KAH6658481.1 dimethylallyl tryptophan synthase GliD1 [Truncatella angustata]KAH8195266.1 hypothetical protein TruAng_010561 [Truncatella angustata]